MPAQLLVHIDPELKRRLKARLAEEGLTLKAWVDRAARSFLGGEGVERPTREDVSTGRTGPEPHVPPKRPVVHPQTGAAPPPAPMRRPEYNVEED